MGRRAKNKKEDKSFRYIVGVLVFISPLDSEKLNPKVTELHLSSKIAMRATRSRALMGAPEFFCYQEILAVMFAQIKNFLPLFLTLFIFLHKKREHKNYFRKKKRGRRRSCWHNFLVTLRLKSETGKKGNKQMHKDAAFSHVVG